MTGMSQSAGHTSFLGDRAPPFEPPSAPLPRIIATPEDLDRWRQEAAVAALQVEDLEAQRRRILASATVEEIRRHDDIIASARVRTERAVAVIADGEARIADRAASGRAAQPERRRKHAAALKARDEAERLVREVYGPAARTIADVLHRLTGLEAIIAAAGDPPEGETSVPSYEAFRHPPEAHSIVFLPLASGVVLPPVTRCEPGFWPVAR